MSRRSPFPVLMLISAFLVLLLSAQAQAATISAPNIEDQFGGTGCTLRDAIISANSDTATGDCPAGSGDDTIELEGEDYDITSFGPPDDTAANGDLDITSNIEIVGSETGRTQIDGMAGVRLFDIVGDAELTLRNVRVIRGDESNDGSDGSGARIQDGGSLFVYDSEFRRNESEDGGAIWIGPDGTFVAERSVFAGNYAYDDDGGAITVDEPGAAAEITDSLLFDNFSVSSGGAVNVEDAGIATITNTTIYNNRASEGGGLNVDDTDTAATLNNVTITGNTAVDGGGVFNDGVGIALLEVKGALIAENIGTDGAPDCNDVTSLGNNLIGDTTFCTINGQMASDLTDVGAGLIQIDDNGGPTETFALDPSSPAVDAGPADAPTEDQRGARRESPEIGAYELVYCTEVIVNRVGTAGDDVLSGTNGDDGFLLYGGDDEADGGSGDDALCGGGGNDQLNGSGGADILLGSTGNDRLDGGGGNDDARGQLGNDRLDGSFGEDVLDGGDGLDRIFGGNDDDTITGSDGNDRIRGGRGGDTASGGEGDDRINGDGGADSLSGDGDEDKIRGDAGRDTIDGGNANDVVSGGDGRDVVDGSGGDDRVNGDDGADELDGGDGVDLVRGGNGRDTTLGSGGTDQIFGGSGPDSMDGGPGEDLCAGGAGGDVAVESSCETVRSAKLVSKLKAVF